jgi:beta-galactosidase/beta-glucuronidase
MQISNGLMNRKHSALINYLLIVIIIITVTMMNGGIIIVVLRKTWMVNGNLTLLKTRVNEKNDFYKVDYDSSSFGTIEVPSEIELNNYAQNNYINTLIPWEGKIYRRPAYALSPDDAQEGSFSDGDDNTVGEYLKHFDLEPSLRGKQVRIRFDGVERAMYVWLNGHFIGYAEDSFTPLNLT